MVLQVGVKVFLRNLEGKYLLIGRSPIKYPNTKGHWDIVGGRIEPGSKLLNNLRREVKEETQLDIIGEPKLVYAQDIIPDEEKHVIRLTYIGNTKGEPVLDTSENIEYKWLSLEEIKNFKDVDIYIKEILDRGMLSWEIAADKVSSIYAKYRRSSSMAEQCFRKAEVGGSTPLSGSKRIL